MKNPTDTATYKPAGGILSKSLSDKSLDINKNTLDNIAKLANNHLKKKGKLLIKNCLTLEVKQSTRKTRFDFIKKEWVECTPKKRLTIKLHKKYIDQIMQGI